MWLAPCKNNKAYYSLKDFDNVEFLKELKRRSDNGNIEIVWSEEKDEITTFGN
ncbi:14405_t:CDS:2 [Cetraspora pellucida]|uniref:14405_t:CDS:1 n=1 Tax=Cetraspora pellucida TaxID=1433469 RepID=A0ACA9LS32_9GLOM|nr:14405_t:CDS:2 [Cetraspora pellucida]